jgi:RNA polymerase primary sigma factor
MRLPLERIERLQELVVSAQATSLETPVGEEGETEMIDLLEDDSPRTPQDDVTRFLQHERIDALLKQMSDRERQIIILRYGLDDSITRTLGETAKFFDITRERVRQIEVVAMRKLRALVAAEDPAAFAASPASGAPASKAAPGKKPAHKPRRRARS